MLTFKPDRACPCGGIVCPQHDVAGAVREDAPFKRIDAGVARVAISHITCCFEINVTVGTQRERFVTAFPKNA